MSDSTVLSVGSETFSSDSRLSVVHVNRSEDGVGVLPGAITVTPLGNLIEKIR